MIKKLLNTNMYINGFYCICLLTLFIAKAIAQEEVFNLNVHEYPPFIEVTSEGSVDGIAVRVVEEAFCRMQLPVKTTLYPWKRAFELARQLKSSGLYPVYKIAEREQWFHYSKSALVIQDNVIVKRANYNLPTEITELSDLHHYNVGYVRGYSLGETLDQIKGVYISEKGNARTPIHAVKELVDKRVDLIIIDRVSLNYILNRDNTHNLVSIIDLAVPTTPAFLAFSKLKTNKSVLKQFDNAMLEMMKDGSYQQIVRVYPLVAQTPTMCMPK